MPKPTVIKPILPTASLHVLLPVADKEAMREEAVGEMTTLAGASSDPWYLGNQFQYLGSHSYKVA